MRIIPGLAAILLTSSVAAAQTNTAAHPLREGRSAYTPSRSMNPAVRLNGWTGTTQLPGKGNPGPGQIGAALQPNDLGFEGH